MRKYCALILCALLLWPSLSWSAMTLGATVVHGAGSGVAAYSPGAYTLTTGRGVIALVVWQQTGGETISSVTVSGESNMTVIGTPSVLATGWTTQLAYLGTVTSGGSKTITVNWTGTVNSYVWLQELHDGSNGGIALDGFCNASNAASADPTCNVTTGSANSAILGALEAHDADPTVGANYTQLNETAFYSWEASEYDLDAGSAGTYAANWTAASGRWSIAAAGFKAAGSSSISGCRLLQNGTDKRLLQNGTTGRILQAGGDCGLGGGPPAVVPVRMLLGVGS